MTRNIRKFRVRGALRAPRTLNLLLLITIFLSLAACQPPAQSGEVLFADDFSNPDSGFKRSADADAVTDYLAGEYQIEVLAPNINVWAVNGPPLAEAKIEATARTAAGTANNLFGVICRYRDDKHFYFFALSADGYYAIGKVIEEDKKPRLVKLTGNDFQPSDKILTGAAANRITAICAGQTLTLIANDAPIAQATDADFTEGKAGLLAGTFNDAPTDVRFDNLVITQP